MKKIVTVILVLLCMSLTALSLVSCDEKEEGFSIDVNLNAPSTETVDML